MSIAIQTKYLGATNYRGSRIVAKAEGGRSITIPYEDHLSPEQGHLAAARAFIKKHGYGKDQQFTLVSGASPDGKGYVFIPVFKWTNKYRNK